MNYKIAIPSYKRSDIIQEKTLNYLKECGIPSNIIDVFVANQEEYEIYKEKVPSNFKIYDGHFAGALQIAKKRKDHKVYWKDIEPLIKKYFNHFKWYGALGFNTSSSRIGARRKTQSMSDYLQSIWNRPKDSKSPYKYFGGILYPIGLDAENNVIYKYNTQKARS